STCSWSRSISRVLLTPWLSWICTWTRAHISSSRACMSLSWRTLLQPSKAFVLY
ncbi:hypothetical protein BGX26_007120, partial [Mortierella sp. AD094]